MHNITHTWTTFTKIVFFVAILGGCTSQHPTYIYSTHAVKPTVQQKTILQDTIKKQTNAIKAPVRATSRPYEINGIQYTPHLYYDWDEVGIASWYGVRDGFHLKPTASGAHFDAHSFMGAHKHLPLPCVVLVTNLENGKRCKVHVNDRGPFKPDRIIDVSERVAKILGFFKKGVARVRVQVLPEESMMLPENYLSFYPNPS